MKRYGLFNDARGTPSDASFFAIQAAVSTYPGDPLRKQLDEIVAGISSLTDQSAQSALAAKGAGLLARALPYIEYCVWDYTLVSSVATKEFASWVDDIQKLADAPRRAATSRLSTRMTLRTSLRRSLCFRAIPRSRAGSTIIPSTWAKSSISSGTQSKQS